MSPEIPLPDGELPLVILPSDVVTITKSAVRLFEMFKPLKRYFRRGGRIMMLSPGSLTLEILDSGSARTEFERVARLGVYRVGANGEKVIKPCACPKDTADAMLLCRDAQSILPEITGLLNCPLIYEHTDGLLYVAPPGYDERSGVLITGGKIPAEVDIETAVKSLLDLFSEFDFSSEGDRARAMASLITPALKLGGFIKGCVPIDVAEADQSQSGKTYRQKVTAMIYNEKPFAITSRNGGVGSTDESLNTALVAGRPFILFDNFRGRLDSQHLECFITIGGSFSCRVPHRGDITVQSGNFFVFLTSNGVHTTPDLANRSSIIRIKKKPAGFKFRKYPEGDLIAHVAANQAFYLGCVFAVIRQWHAAGKPTTEDTRHDFRDWVGILDWIIQHIFKLCPIMDGHQQAQESVGDPDLVFLRSLALLVEQSHQLGKPLLANDLAAICDAANLELPGHRKDIRDDAAGLLQIGRCMGRLFREEVVRNVDKYCVYRSESEVLRHDKTGYINQKTYTFTISGTPPPPVTTPRSVTLPPLVTSTPQVTITPEANNVSFKQSGLPVDNCGTRDITDPIAELLP